MEKIRNKEIYEKFKSGIAADDIAKEEGISRARVYQIISSIDRIKEKPILDDSKVVQELKQKIAALEEKINLLQEDNRRLLGIIEKLIK